MLKITGTIKSGDIKLVWKDQLVDICQSSSNKHAECSFLLQPCEVVDNQIQHIEGNTGPEIKIPREEIFDGDSMSWDLIHEYFITWLKSNFIKLKAEKV